MNKKISIIGAGSWGTTLAVILAKAGVKIKLHSLFPEHNCRMETAGENQDFLPGFPFPENLQVESSTDAIFKNKIILLAIPVKFLRSSLKKLKTHYSYQKGHTLVSVIKGIENGTLKRPSQIIREELVNGKIAVLSGPTIAKEVASGVPTTCVIAAGENKLAAQLRGLLSTNTFRVYSSSDLIGVELSGALKNIIAIACGISDGLGFGVNTKAALVTRGLAEISRLGKKMGAAKRTFAGISGVGDLATTCFSYNSRNRFVGEQIGKGRKLKDIISEMNMVAEGVNTVKSAYNLSQKSKIEMPITTEVYRVLYRRKSPDKAVSDLMLRKLKSE
jgi:glycerol-3-phosphate dehydrogenase (NAD(P)+)